jgi:hypothetical protein
MVEAYYTGHLAVAPIMGRRGPEPSLVPGGNGSAAEFAFRLKPVLDITPVRGAAGKEQFVGAVGDVSVGQS